MSYLPIIAYYCLSLLILPIIAYPGLFRPIIAYSVLFRPQNYYFFLTYANMRAFFTHFLQKK